MCSPQLVHLPSATARPGTQSRSPHGWQTLNNLNHHCRLSGSALAENCNQEPRPGIKPRCSDVRHMLNTKPCLLFLKVCCGCFVKKTGKGENRDPASRPKMTVIWTGRQPRRHQRKCEMLKFQRYVKAETIPSSQDQKSPWNIHGGLQKRRQFFVFLYSCHCTTFQSSSKEVESFCTTGISDDLTTCFGQWDKSKHGRNVKRTYASRHVEKTLLTRWMLRLTGRSQAPL